MYVIIIINSNIYLLQDF